MAKYYSETLQKGSKGDSVSEWQRFLNSQGYNLSVDGDFGTNTHNATIDYQTKNGLGVDGIVGKNTWGHAGYSLSPSSQTFEYDDFAYDDYTESDTVLAAGQKASDAEGAVANYGDYQWSDQEKYNNLIKEYENRGDFSYDFNADALYQQYKDKYIQQGKMAMADTIGQASAMTGGYGNSYAATAGNQAYQSHLNNLNDVIPELYQMAYDRYNQKGQDMLNMIGLLGNERNFDYGVWSDKYNKLLSDRDYYGSRYDSERTLDYSKYTDDRDFSYGKYSDDRNLAYNEHRNAIADEQWQKDFDEAKRQYDESMAWQKSQASAGGSGSGGSGGSGGGGGGGGGKGGTYADTLWYNTGTYDDNGNPVFRNSEGKTQAYGEGINPYTGTKHPDAKHGTFSNGYQPNNINGKKLKNSGMSTNVTGKSQTIWECGGKYWLWRGDLNKYIEVDVSDID